MSRRKAVADRLLDSLVSKKLTVFSVATVFVSLEIIAGDAWVDLALMYIGTQGAIDAIVKLRGSR